LLLREDNADLRLTPRGRELGLVDEHRWKLYSEQHAAIVAEQRRLQGLLLRPDSGPGAVLSAWLEKPLAREQRAYELLRRPGVRYADLMAVEGIGPGVVDARVAGQIEIQARYSGYLERQQAEIHRQHRQQEQALPADFDYNAVRGLSSEVCEKLQRVKPQTIGQASRIPGITPAAVSLLLIHLRKRGHEIRQGA
jgi:tRNA uridine 5-carboxymethylaminomethyl modification enzyme